MSNAKSISAGRLAEEILKTGVAIIDVRTPNEFHEAHLPDARNVPLGSLDPQEMIDECGQDGGPVYVICQAGVRGARACQMFHEAGFTHVANVEGGMQACIEAGMPVIVGKNGFALERQVRITAGLLVLLGVILGITSSPVFLGLSAFVGAGLVFAGVTNRCGIGMLLAKMPWNTKPAKQSDASCQAQPAH